MIVNSKTDIFLRRDIYQNFSENKIRNIKQVIESFFQVYSLHFNPTDRRIDEARLMQQTY